MTDQEQQAQSEPQRDWLIKEYELCQSSAQSLESRIWQTSAALGAGSIGLLVSLANKTASEQPPRLVGLGIGLLVICSNFTWFGMARRWWSVQHAKLLRMMHIEKALGLGQNCYVHYADFLAEQHPTILSIVSSLS